MFESLGELLAKGMRAFAFYVANFIILPIIHLTGHELVSQTRQTVDAVVPPEQQSQRLKDVLDRMEAGEGEWQAILGGTAAGTATGGLISSTIGPYLLLLQYEIQRLVGQQRWDPMTAAAILFRRPDLEELIKSDITDLGWTLERWEGLIEAALTRLKEDDLVILRFRFGLSKEDYHKRMYELGYTKERAEDFYNTRLYYPTPADLVRWQAKEVFEPEMVRRYGLDAELGELEREAFYKAGMTDPQIKNYWMAHWEHASWMQIREMLFRGLLTPTPETPEPPTTKEAWAARDAQGFEAMYDWYRLVEIPPFWRDRLTRTAFAPFTRVDVRRMHKTGVLDEDQVYSAYRWHGFDHERAEAMTNFTLRYNATEDRDLTKTDILSSYRKGALDEGAARELLAEIDFGDDEIDFLLAKEEQDVATRQRDLTVSNYSNLYQIGIMPKEKVTEALAELGYDAEEIALLYQLWDAEAPAKTRQPTRAELTHFLSVGIIDIETFAQEMSSIDYPEKYINWYRLEFWQDQLEVAQKEEERARKEEERVEKALVKTTYEIERARLDVKIAEAQVFIQDMQIAMLQVPTTEEREALAELDRGETEALARLTLDQRQRIAQLSLELKIACRGITDDEKAVLERATLDDRQAIELMTLEEKTKVGRLAEQEQERVRAEISELTRGLRIKIAEARKTIAELRFEKAKLKLG